MRVDLMWIWWAGTVGLCGWKLAEAVLRPIRMLEWPFLACAMWAYFYGYMAYDAKIHLSAYLGNGMSDIGQLMAFLCLVGLLAGWSLGKKVRINPPSVPRDYPIFYVWMAGFFFLLLGAAGGYSVMHAADTGTLNYQASSGYWILLFYVGYPGLAMAVWALCKMEPGMRRKLCVVITALGLIAFMAPHMVNARRGPLFPAIIVLLVVPYMTLRRPPNRLLFCGVLATAGLVMLLFLQIRVVTYNGGTWSEAIQNLNINAAVADKGKDVDDNEYLNSCVEIGTIYQTGKYQYGTGHLGLLMHWVPRAVWRNKPILGEGIHPFEELFDDVESATGIQLMGTGASSAGVADSFLQYGIFCPIFWFALSWVFGAVFAKAVQGRSPRWLFCYVGILCASHWLVSQSLSAAFVPGMYFQVVPAAAFLVFSFVSTPAVATPKRRPLSRESGRAVPALSRRSLFKSV
jgi:hypothetical protein